MTTNQSFRLIDFHVYNEKRQSDSESDHSGDAKIKDNTAFTIQMFGVNEAGETASILVDDFQPFFYIHVPDGFTETMKKGFVSDIEKTIGKYYASSLVESKLVQKKKLR